LKIETKRYAMERKASKRIADVSVRKKRCYEMGCCDDGDFAGRPGLNLRQGIVNDDCRTFGRFEMSLKCGFQARFSPFGKG